MGAMYKGGQVGVSVLVVLKGSNMQQGPVNPLLRFCLNSSRQTPPSQLWVEIDHAAICSEIGSNIQYLSHYQASSEGNRIFMPIVACDNILLHGFGDLRFFFTSAHQAKLKENGMAIMTAKMPSPFTHVVAIRATIPYTSLHVQIYLGLNKNSFIIRNQKKALTSRLLCLRSELPNQRVSWFFSNMINVLTYPSLVKFKLHQNPNFLSKITDIQSGIELKENLFSNTLCYWPEEEKDFKYKVALRI